MSFNPEIDETRCNACEECLEACTAEVFEMRNGKPTAANPQRCQGCECCVAVCKENAITVKEDARVALSETCLTLFKDIL